MGEERHQTPAHHLEILLARAQNPFDVCDAVLHRLRSAVMFRVELYGWRHRNTPPPTLRCSSFRHIFLLADGSSLLLWELCYDSEHGAHGHDGHSGGVGGQGTGDELCEVYDCEESLRRSERRVHRRMGADGPGESAEDAGNRAGADGAGCPGESPGWDALEEEPRGFGAEGVPSPFDGWPDLSGQPLPDSSPFGPPFDGSPFDGPPSDELPFADAPFEDRRFDDPVLGNVAFGELGAEDLEPGLDRDLDDLGPAAERGGGPARASFEFLVAGSGAGAGRREYAERGSPDHARRLLRRAENEDRPGDETLRLLDKALAHQILHVPGPLARAGECHVWCSVYEHAFLLADGSEISLYELEHNLTGSGRLVCEVYLDESVAGQAAHRLARDRGIDL